MPENKVESLQTLHEKIEQLKVLCVRLRQERDGALKRLAETKAQLVNTEVKVAELERKNRTLQALQLGSVSVEAAKQNRTQLSKLVREIDKCIALLDA